MQTTPSSLHSRTPTLAVNDPRGLGIRSVAYHRRIEAAVPDARIERVCCDARGYQALQWDARLPEPTASKTWSLSGKPLRVRNVDAGWRVTVFASTDLPAQTWDSRGTGMRYTFDDMLRPVATHERMTGSTERCVERFAYGPASAIGNRRGVLIRHDDTAGTKTAAEYTLSGAPLDDTRRFLATTDVPDWPEDVQDREAMLEADAWTTRRRYDALGEVVVHTDARGNTQRSTRGVDGSLRQVWLGLAGGSERCLLRETAFDAEGSLVRRVDGNGIERQWVFAAANHRLTGASVRRGDAMLQNLSYAYDAVGNIVSTEDSTQSTLYFSGRKVEPVNRYTYDTLYRLIGASGRESVSPAAGPGVPAWQPEPGEALVGFEQTYEYDEAGNLLSLRHAGAQSYTRRMAVSGSSNRSMPLVDGEPPPDLVEGFDANGNLRRLQPGQELAWSGRNMLLRTTRVVRAQADDDERYTYDGACMRVRKLGTTLVGGQSRRRDIRYLSGLEYRNDEITGERLQVIRTEIDGGDVRTLHWEDDTVPAGIDNDTDRYAVADHLGSCTLEFDGNASLVSHEWYHPYGSTAGCVARNSIEAGYKTVHYAGKERDDSGLHYYGFRFYASWLMRWIHPDPAGDVDGLNRFAMVGGNPLTHADAAGLAPPGRRDILPTAFDSAIREFMITLAVMGLMLLATVGAEQLFGGGERSVWAHGTLGTMAGGVAVAGWVGAANLPHRQPTGLVLALGGAALTAGNYLLALMDSGAAANAAVSNMVATSVYALANEATQQLFSGIGNTLQFEGPTPLGLIAANTLLGGLAYGASAFAAYYADSRIVDYMLAQPAAAGALMAATTAVGVGFFRNRRAEVANAGQRISSVDIRDVLLRGALRIASQGAGDLLAAAGNWANTQQYPHLRRFLERFLGNLANEARGYLGDWLFYDPSGEIELRQLEVIRDVSPRPPSPERDARSRSASVSVRLETSPPREFDFRFQAAVTPRPGAVAARGQRRASLFW